MHTPRDLRWFPLVSLCSALVVGSFGCGGSTAAADPTASGGGDSATGEQASTGGGENEADLDEGEECSPYEDSCGPALACQIVGDRTRCAAEGSSERDERCEESPCQRGSVCLWDGYNDTCQQPCTLDGAVKCDIARHTCFAAVDEQGNELPFGVCRY